MKASHTGHPDEFLPVNIIKEQEVKNRQKTQQFDNEYSCKKTKQVKHGH